MRVPGNCRVILTSVHLGVHPRCESCVECSYGGPKMLGLKVHVPLGCLRRGVAEELRDDDLRLAALREPGADRVSKRVERCSLDPRATVYISLNDPYFPIINGPKPRPLDFAYLKSLTPTAQRFYELVSPKMYAAIKNDHPSAWTRYSEFCQLAVQRRYDTRRRMQIQMAAVHQPHLASGYVAEVSYRAVPSLDGVLDWTIHYVPGPRARTEFHAFNPGYQRQRMTRPAPCSTPPVSSGETNLEPEHELPQTQSAARSLALRFVQIRFGVSAGAVTPGQLDRAQRILDALDGVFDAAVLAVEIAATHGRSDKKGFPNHLGGVIEGGFVERARAIRKEEVERETARTERARLESRRNNYNAWCNLRSERRVRELTPEARSRIVDERLPKFVEEFSYYLQLKSWSSERIRVWAELRILKQYGREGEPTFDAWSDLHETEMTGSSGPAEALQ